MRQSTRGKWMNFELFALFLCWTAHCRNILSGIHFPLWICSIHCNKILTITTNNHMRWLKEIMVFISDSIILILKQFGQWSVHKYGKSIKKWKQWIVWLPYNTHRQGEELQWLFNRALEWEIRVVIIVGAGCVGSCILEAASVLGSPHSTVSRV